jgi:spore coat polysaccharide biosynthesis protein SpsF
MALMKATDRLIIIQARMNSVRLPGKILMPFKGREVLGHIIDALLDSFTRDSIVVATSDQSSDNAVEDYCLLNKIYCHRGSENNVAQRFYDLVKDYKPLMFARICADSPLIDASIVSRSFLVSEENQADIVTTVGTGLPSGMNVEVVSTDIYMSNYLQFQCDKHYEHVTSYFYDHADQFRIMKLPLSLDKGTAIIKLSLDTATDAAFINLVFNEFSRPHYKYALSEKIAISQLINDRIKAGQI